MKVHYADDMVQLLHGDALASARTLEAGAVQTIVTSPPYYGLRDYGAEGQIGAEDSLDEYVEALVAVFGELARVLADDGTLWVNLGDSYAGRANSGAGYTGNHGKFGKPGHVPYRKNTTSVAPYKNLLGVPWRVAFALQANGWILRSEIIWSKPNPMPESVTDRPTNSHEKLFLFAKQPAYYYDANAIKVGASGTAERPQRRRALEIAEAKGLSSAHLAAIRAVGVTDAGKATVTQSGAGRNSPDVAQLAAEAKAALGGYYREFLMAESKNVRNVWEIPTVPLKAAHFAAYPPELVRPCILAGSRPGDTVLDPFSGSGTTGMVANQEGRRYVGFDLNAEYLDLSLRTRFAQPSLGVEVGA